MGKKRRVDVRKILADPDLRRELMVPTIQATQAREGIETSREEAERAYYVVTEGEKAAFFDLERFKGGRGESERRHEMFVRALRDEAERVRFDVARRDFAVIDGAPLAYRRVGLVAHVFREHPPLEPGFGRARRGAYTGNDSQYVRYWWELPKLSADARFTWKPFAKGGGFCRFYSDVDLVVHWDPQRRTFARFYGRKGRETARPESLDDFFKPGLTWPLAAGAFNTRWMPVGCVFGHKGPAIFPKSYELSEYLAGILNTHVAEYLLQGLTSRQGMGGRWEVGVIKRLPVPKPPPGLRHSIEEIAKAIHDAKASWDEGNETSTRFRAPWLLRDDLVDDANSVAARLDRLGEREAEEEARIQELYAELNDLAYKLYGIPEKTRGIIEETLGDRPPEVLWPQMERKTVEQKRMEHVFRLLSYTVKRVVEEDDDGIVPFQPAAGKSGLVDRVRYELQSLFPEQDVGEVEVALANELKKNVKGYRRTDGISDWLETAFFEYHASLYQKRPILWHVASSQGTTPFAFGALVHYHRFDGNRMAQLRAQYLRDATHTFRREAGLADKELRTEARMEWQARLEEAEELDRRLQWVQEGHHEGPAGGDRDYRILTPWKPPEARPRGWAPDVDDGVKVNVEPLQKAGVLRVAKVI
jgi:hypothetical protein